MWKLAPNPGLLDAQKAAKRDYSCSLRKSSDTVRRATDRPATVEPRAAAPTSETSR